MPAKTKKRNQKPNVAAEEQTPEIISEGVPAEPDSEEPSLSVPKQRNPHGRKVCISGFADATREQANKLDKSWEIWSLNRCYTFLKRWNRHFEVHEKELYTGKTGLRESDYIERIRKSGVPVYMMHPDPDFGDVHPYPFYEICAYFGQFINPNSGNEHFEYYTTTIAYMLALALYEHKVENRAIDTLFICGVDMSAFSEYSEQLPCVNFWLGALMGAEVKIDIPSASPLLKSAASYGRHQERALWAMANERIEMYQNKQEQGSANLNALSGADSEYSYVINTIESRIKRWQSADYHDRPDGVEGQFFGTIETKTDEQGENQIIWEELTDTPTELAHMIDFFKGRRKEIAQFHAQVNADLNSTLGGYRECQHWLTVFNAPQTREQEPKPVKMVDL